MVDFVYIQEFFDALDFEIEVIYQNLDKAKGEHLYLLNSEPVFIETKNEVRPQNIHVFEQLSNREYPLLIASKYITPKSKKILKNKGINYIDSFGNAFINLSRLKLYIEQGNAKPYLSDTSIILTQSGGQILFQLLKNPEIINETYRYLAHISDVSLGSVSNFMKGLIEEGFAVKWNAKQKYQLIKREELLERWINVFNEKILPAYKIGNYTFSPSNKSDWKNQLLHPNLLWAGESGAALITDYLSPETYTLFTSLSKQEILVNLKLLPSDSGEISIYKPFWKESNTMERVLNYKNTKNVAHPILIYAQLIYTGNDRNLETAKILYDEYIAPHL
jgi:hypothetical protein